MPGPPQARGSVAVVRPARRPGGDGGPIRGPELPRHHAGARAQDAELADESRRTPAHERAPDAERRRGAPDHLEPGPGFSVPRAEQCADPCRAMCRCILILRPARLSSTQTATPSGGQICEASAVCMRRRHAPANRRGREVPVRRPRASRLGWRRARGMTEPDLRGTVVPAAAELESRDSPTRHVFTSPTGRCTTGTSSISWSRSPARCASWGATPFVPAMSAMSAMSAITIAFPEVALWLPGMAF